MENSRNEVVKCEIPKELYFQIPKHIRENISIKEVSEPDFDYSSNEDWIKLKDASTKVYKALKKVEYSIRHKS